jgi:cellulose synthase/poly-beta-1,6-N-acetylglucosamine synthase-like glycosyltransferase
MSIGFDPIIPSLLFSANLIPHAARPKAELEIPTVEPLIMPFVTVIVALYREKREDIEMTVQSLLCQTYPKDKFEVLLAVEARDSDIRTHVAAAIEEFRCAGISSSLVISDGGKRLKAYALNRAIEQARGEFCVFYDASDEIESTQVRRAISLMKEKNYDAVQATVLRKGKSILSHFLLIDTAFWFRKYIPFVLGFAQGMPLSGEGLFVRTAILNEVGGFPEVLTEDAYLGILLTEKRKRFGLVSSVITEKAPKNVRAHFVQRLRWNRGYLTCLLRLLRSRLPLKRKSALLLPFLTPLSCSLAFLGWILILSQSALSMFGAVSIPDFTSSFVRHPVYTHLTFYWAALLFCVGIPLCVASYVHTLWVLGMRRYVPLLILLPYYWTFIGLAATCSFFKSTKHWGRTER